MQNEKEKKLIKKNNISFIISLCPIYTLIVFGTILKRSEILNYEGSKGDAFGIIVVAYILYIALLVSCLIAIPAFCFTIKYIIDILKNKKKVFIAIIEIIIYILIMLFFIVKFNQLA